MMGFNDTLSDSNYTERIEKAHSSFSFVNQRAYQDVFLLSNPLLSRNPFSSNFLKRYLNNEEVDLPPRSKVLLKLIRYYVFSFRDFISYLKEFIEFRFSLLSFKPSRESNELVLIDTFFVIDQIRQTKDFRDIYFPGLEPLLKNSGKDYAYFPTFDGPRRVFEFYSILKIFKKKKTPVLTEYQLFSFFDFFHLLCFIIFYPLSVLRLLRSLNIKNFEERLMICELINTLDQITLRSFSRFLQGKRIAKMPYKKIKIISWFENQTIHKNFYKGLRIRPKKVVIYGAQLFLFSKYQMNVVPNEEEARFGILPDKIIVNGPQYLPKKTNLKYVVGPSLRYYKIFKARVIDRERKKNILALLPYFKEDALNILNVLKNYKERFFIKFHPSTNFNSFGGLIPKQAVLTKEDTYNLLATTKILIGAASGTMLESVSLGIPVICIKNKMNFTCNPLSDYGKGITWEEVETYDELEFQIDKFENLLNKEYDKICSIARDYKRLFFCEPTEEKIRESFDL